jgi:hypothetical protein
LEEMHERDYISILIGLDAPDQKIKSVRAIMKNLGYSNWYAEGKKMYAIYGDSHSKLDYTEIKVNGGHQHYRAESYNASTKKTKPRKTHRIKTMIELNPDLPITSHNHPDNPMVGHIEQKCSSDVCDETVLTHDRRIGKRCLKCYYQNWEDLYDMGATDTPPPVDMSIPYDVRYKRNTPAEIAEQEKRSIALQKQINANRSKRYEQLANRPQTPLWSKNPKNILGLSWEDIQNEREWDKQYAQILKDKKEMSDKVWRKKYGIKSAGSKNDPDFDSEKADRNKDGKISEWEQSVGNAVAKGIREHSKKQSKSESYDAETFAAYVSKADTQRVRQLLKQGFPNLKFSVIKDSGRMSVRIMAGDIDFSDLNDDIPRTKRHWERWGYPKPVFKGIEDINNYHLDGYNPKYTSLFEKIISIMKGEAWFDNSDAQTDYFSTAYYISLGIGKWNKPYEYNPNLKKGTKPTMDSLIYQEGYGDDALKGLKGAYDAESFNAVAIAPKIPKTAVDKALMQDYLMNKVAKEQLKVAMTYELALRNGGYRPNK